MIDYEYSVIKQFDGKQWHFVVLTNDNWDDMFLPFLCYCGDKEGKNRFITDYCLDEKGFVVRC